MIKFGSLKMDASLNRTFLILLLLVSSTIYSQKINIKKVTLDDVRNTICEFDTTANAVILYKYRTTYFNDLQPDKWEIITEIHERIKILNKKGLSYATNYIQLRKSSDNKEILSNFEGLIYSYNGKRIITRKIKKETIKKSELSDSLDVVKIELSNVKAGDIVEYSYKIVSPFYKIDNIVLQEDIPIKYCYNSIKIPSYFSYNRIVNSRLKITANEFEQQFELKPFTTKKYANVVQRHLLISTKDSILQTTEKVVEYEVENVEALKPEMYIDNIENYRAFIAYNLVATEFVNQAYKEYAFTLEEVLNTIIDSDKFGKQLQELGFLEENAKRIAIISATKMQLVQNALEFIKKNISWNQKEGVFTSKPIKDAFIIGEGNAAEINLALVGLLRALGLEANPVLSRTRSQGISYFPSLSTFNYVIASVNINGETFLLDATENYSAANVLPIRTLNGEGVLIHDKDKSFQSIKLYPSVASEISTIMQIDINDIGNLMGKLKTSYTLMDAMDLRMKLNEIGIDKNIEAVKQKYELEKISDYKFNNRYKTNKPLIESFSFDTVNGVEISKNQMSVSPLFFFALNENPFKLMSRVHPINFNYSRLRKKIINIRIPKDYKIISLPKSIKLKLPNNLGSYLFNVSEINGGINLVSVFKLNEAIILPNKYFELKEYYNQIILKEMEKIILEK